MYAKIINISYKHEYLCFTCRNCSTELIKLHCKHIYVPHEQNHIYFNYTNDEKCQMQVNGLGKQNSHQL